MHGYGWNDSFVYLTDNGKYINHSKETNLEFYPLDNSSSIAKRDI